MNKQNRITALYALYQEAIEKPDIEQARALKEILEPLIEKEAQGMERALERLQRTLAEEEFYLNSLKNKLSDFDLLK